MRIATWNVEWFNGLFDDAGRLLMDEGRSSRYGVTRGDHFHLNKVERFLVVQGEAVIRIRKVLSDEVWEYRVSGDAPSPVDMPTLHTHSIENVGKGDLLTLFWTHDLFDPAIPDTFADKVIK